MWVYYYDLSGRFLGTKASNNTSYFCVYDDFNRVSKTKTNVNGTAIQTQYVYGDSSSLIDGITINGVASITYSYDELARLYNKTRNTTVPFATEYSYLPGAGANTTTALVQSVKNGNDILEYTYDELGNITTVSKNGIVIEQYSYDALNQLIGAVYGGDTYTYSYDTGGNITEVKKNGTVIQSYTYGNAEWKDLLTSFCEEDITYDGIGNPLTYRDGMSMTWQNGRQLAGVSQNGSAVAAYTYNADGRRTLKNSQWHYNRVLLVEWDSTGAEDGK